MLFALIVIGLERQSGGSIEIMGDKIKQCWSYLQDLMDVRGDCIMMAFSSALIFRIVLSAFGKAAITPAEAAAYASAIGAFAYSNRGPKI